MTRQIQSAKRPVERICVRETPLLGESVLILGITIPMVRCYPHPGALAEGAGRRKKRGKSTKRGVREREEGKTVTHAGDSFTLGIWLQMDDGEYGTSLGVTHTRSAWRRLGQLPLQSPLAGCSTHLPGASTVHCGAPPGQKEQDFPI